jgi:hypothetical protein
MPSRDNKRLTLEAIEERRPDARWRSRVQFRIRRRETAATEVVHLDRERSNLLDGQRSMDCLRLAGVSRRHGSPSRHTLGLSMTHPGLTLQ